MANSKNSIGGQDPWQFSTRTGGPLGHNSDAGDPNTPRWFLGDTPGPLGIRDGGDPDSPMLRPFLPPSKSPAQLNLPQSREPVPDYLQEYLSRVRDPAEDWVAQQKFSKKEIDELRTEMQNRLTMFAGDEAALTSEIDKVQKDIEVWKKVESWFATESATREVLVQEVKDKFNDSRWGGTGVKVGGIDVTQDGAAVISDEFASRHPAIIVQGYKVHEEVHARHFKEMGTAEAFFGSLSNPLRSGDLLEQTWAANRKIKSELEAHKVQLDFYTNYLTNLRSEKARSERIIQILNSRK